MYKAPQDYLNADAAAGRVMAHARLLMRLSRRFASSAPSALSASATVANYRPGKVIIHARNGAVAAKLRQLTRRLCVDLSKEGVECNEIEVKVQPIQTPLRSTSSTIKPLSKNSFGILQKATADLPEGPLRKALERLLERAAHQGR